MYVGGVYARNLFLFCNLILIIFILLFSLRWIRKTIALIVQNEMLAPLIKCTRRKKYNNNNNVQKLHFISAHFSLFNKFADKRADSTHKTKDLRHKLDHLTPTTQRTMRCAYLWNFCRFPATKPKQKFQFHSQLCHTQRKPKIKNNKKKRLCHGYAYNRRCLSFSHFKCQINGAQNWNKRPQQKKRKVSAIYLFRTMNNRHDYDEAVTITIIPLSWNLFFSSFVQNLWQLFEVGFVALCV